MTTIDKLLIKFKSSGLKQAYWTISEQGFSSIFVFLTGILLARATTKDDFGMYILGLGLMMIMLGFQRAVISTPYAILFRQEKEEERKKYRYAIWMFQMAFLLINFLILFFTIFYMFIYDLEKYYLFIASLFILVIGQSSLYFFKYLLIAELEVKKNFIYCIIVYLSALILLLCFFTLGKLNTNITYAITGITSILVSLGFYIFFFSTSIETINSYEFKEYFKKNWKLGKWIVGSNIGFMFSSQIFPWILLVFWNKVSVAELGVVLSISRILAPAVQGFWSFLLPKMTIYVDDLEKLALMIKQLVLAMVITAFLLISTGYLFGEWIIELLYSSKYSGLGLLITLGFVLQGINLINMPVDAGLNALKRTDLGFKSLLIGVVTSFVIGVPLTIIYGVPGALIGMIASAFSGLLYRGYKLKYILNGDK